MRVSCAGVFTYTWTINNEKDRNMSDVRTCDGCDLHEDAGGFPDWVNGSCPSCDPDLGRWLAAFLAGEDVPDLETWWVS